MSSETIVSTPAEAARLEHGAAIILQPLREFLDAVGIGRGSLSVTPIAGGHSNLTFELERGSERFALRRPPRGQLSRSANDVIRESRVLAAVANTPVPVPEVLARCEDDDVIGAPFFVMSFVDGQSVNDRLPKILDREEAPPRILAEAVSALVALHAADTRTSGLDAFGRPSGYLERQLKIFSSLLAQNATRPLPDLDVVAEWLAKRVPEAPETTFVHGDYRLGNLLFTAPLRLAAVLDWELATMGDPLSDLGYLTAMWAAPTDAPNPMFELSRVTTRTDFPGREEVARAYGDASGRDISGLLWYQVLALWKSAIFLEGSFKRYQAGASGDSYFALLAEGVPALARAARAWTERPLSGT